MAHRKKERKFQPSDFRLTGAKIEMLANREIVVDGCKGVVEYDENLIKLNIGDLVLCIAGDEMVIDSFDSDVAIIRGKFISVSFVS